MTQPSLDDPTPQLETHDGGLVLPLAAFASGRTQGFLFLTIQEFLTHWQAIVGLTLALYLPIALAKNVIIYTLGYQEDFRVTLQAGALLTLVDALLAPAITYAIIYRLHYQSALPFRSSLRWGLKKWGKSLYFRILSTLLIALGFLLFVIPGLVLGVWFALIDVVVAVEGSTQKRVLERSRELTRGCRWAIFWSGCAVMVLVLAFFLLVGLSLAVWDHWIVETLVDCLSGIATQLFVVFALVVYLKIVAKRATAT
jgi:hypothetical protein